MIGRGQGRSAVACAAYRSGTRIKDERYGRTHDYSFRTGVQLSGVSAPQNAPSWTRNRSDLWNQLEAFEKRKDAQLAREFVLGLPHLLSLEQQAEVLERFIRSEFLARGLVADWAIHDANQSGDVRNVHAHVMVTMRTLSPAGFDPIKERELNTPLQLNAWRANWAEAVNQAFREHGVLDAEGRLLEVDHRSYEDQGLALEPTYHMGVHATAMERRGKLTELGERNRSILKRNEMQPDCADSRRHGAVRGFLSSTRAKQREAHDRERSDQYNSEMEP
ncbi:MAG: MobA/MobL family protein [Armatimonadetes bacterium]|nr:MobA/MobL family protein [Armatimonadota bacterium]